MNTAANILEKIEALRNKMSTIAFNKGLSSEESVEISQELDRLLNLYDTMKNWNQ